MRRASLIIVALLGACQRQPMDAPPEVQPSLPQAEALERPAVPSAPIRAVEQEVMPTPEPEAAVLCWQDYCPCDDPVTALDHTICRNARGGIEMTDDQWSIGAMARDLKYSGDESNRQMDEVMSDAQAQRASQSAAEGVDNGSE